MLYSATDAVARVNSPYVNATAALLLPQSVYARRLVYVYPAKARVTDGARTRDLRDHNPMLCQLSYGHQAMVQFYQPALGVQKLLPTRCRSEAPLPSINRDQLDSATQYVISAPHHCAIGRLLHHGTRGPKSCRSAHRILLPASKDSNRRHSYSGPTLVPVPRRKIFSLSLLTFAGGSIRPFGTCRTPV